MEPKKGIGSLVLPMIFFRRVNGWNQDLDLDNLKGKITTGNHIDTYYNGHHFNMFNHFFWTMKIIRCNEFKREFPVNFNETLQEAYLSHKHKAIYTPKMSQGI